MSAPRIAVIDGALASRLFVAAMLRLRWPDADIEEIDPFAQTLYGAGPLLSSGRDLIIAGGLGAVDEAVQRLARIDAPRGRAAVLLLVSRAMMAPSDAHPAPAAELIAAGAGAMLYRDTISGQALVATAAQLLAGDRATGPRAQSACGSFLLSVHDGARAVQIEDCRPVVKLAGNELNHVFRAERIGSGEPVVVKVMNGIGPADQPALRAYMTLLGFLGSAASPGVVRMLDTGLADLIPYMVFEYLGGGDLRARMTAPLEPDAAIRIVTSLARALEPLHARRIAHMDVKPENIFARDDGTLALIDFNAATQFGAVAGKRTPREVVGTPHYMSPEQGQGLPVDGRSDLYSVGVLLYEMLTGVPPFEADTSAALIYKHIHDEIPLLPRGLRAYQPLVDRLLAKQPEQRFQNANELALALAGPA